MVEIQVGNIEDSVTAEDMITVECFRMPDAILVVDALF